MAMVRLLHGFPAEIAGTAISRRLLQIIRLSNFVQLWHPGIFMTTYFPIGERQSANSLTSKH